MSTATAEAHPNIAVVKYWGKRDPVLNLPAVPSISVTLDRYLTRTTVDWGIEAEADEVRLNHAPADDKTAAQVAAFLDLVAPERPRCRVVSENSFPTAAGLASSSSAFAALALAATAAAGQERGARELSILARQGSGSACRSLWGGWVMWQAGSLDDGSDSHGVQLFPREHWDLRVVVALVGKGPKKTASRAGMTQTALTSPYYPAWVETALSDIAEARRAIKSRDLERLGRVMEWSTLKMHATMLTTEPSIRYWQPFTLMAMQAVEDLRAAGTGAWYTMDAGPNVKVLCDSADAETVAAALRDAVGEVEVLGVGGDARLVKP